MLGVIALASAAASYHAVEGLVRNAASVTLFVALAGFVITLVRDEGAHQRAIELADRAHERSLAAEDREHERLLAASEREARFALGVSSHMANVAFDKHVAFCEAYAQVADKALSAIFREGPTADAVYLSGSLLEVRRTHAVWITQEIDEKLQQFEHLFVEMGASAGYVQSTQGVPEASQRQEHVDRMYKHLSTLTGALKWKDEKLDEEKAVITTIRWLRNVLGTEELNAMRRAFVKRAMTELEN